MTGVLCIDFGTSSIRAVRRLPGGRLKALDIGRVTHSRLDDASIRSEIHIDEHGRNVRYGERAIVARAQPGIHVLFEASPKLWFRNPENLHRHVAEGIGLTRANLIAGLLANAIRACIKAEGLSATTLKSMDVRVAHPVWPPAVRSQARAALHHLCEAAKCMASEREWATVTVATLKSYTAEPARPTQSPVDVVEPIAASVEMLPSEENARRLCAVIDVGAGTTDIGLFRAVSPDLNTTVRGKLYPMGSPKSVFKAGNFIDEVVLELIVSRARRPGAEAVAEVESRIRQVKETLFQNEFVQELGVDVQIEDLRSHPGAKAIAREIRAELEAAVAQSSKQIDDMLDATTHSVKRLEVVMAGGGGAIDFIQRAISEPIALNGRSLPVEVTMPDGDRGLNLHGAGRGRMAVALGGASREYDTLIHEMPNPGVMRVGPM